jgi:bis(5'-nucleosyl)-tetraphosphatase (symmetrical)
MEKRVIIYGDIHGCLQEFEKLRKKLHLQKDDIEISVGDFLNKGPYSLNTLRYLNYHHIQSVMGNNEAKIIKLYHKYQKLGKDYLKTLRESDKRTLLELEEKDIKYLESLPYYIKIQNLTIVHGGIVNGMKLSDKMSEKEKKLLTQLRFFNAAHEPIPYEDFENRKVFWSQEYDGSEGFVIFGHHPFEKVKIDKHAIGIDTGCVYGGKLTAITFTYHDSHIDTSNYTLYQQKAKQKHFR